MRHWFPPLLALALHALCTRAAVTADQLTAVFGSLDGLKGGSAKLSVISSELVVVANSSHALVVIQVSDWSTDKAGWISIGLGTTMADADEMVFWPNSDYSWTLSHRAGGSMEEPLDLGADAANFALVPSLSSGDSGEAFTQVAYLRPLKATYQSSSTNLELTSGAALIYARASSNPLDCKASATLAYHDGGYGQTSIKFDAAVAAGASVGTGGSTTGGGLQAEAACTAKGALKPKKGSSSPSTGGGSSDLPASAGGSTGSSDSTGNSTGGPDSPKKPAVDKCTIPSGSPYQPYAVFICPNAGQRQAPLFWPYFLALLTVALVIPHQRRIPP